MRGGVPQVRLISPVLFYLYVNDMPLPSHYVELALYTHKAIITTSRKPTLLASYLESYLNEIHRWLSEWIIEINVPKSTAIIFARAGRRFIQLRPVTFYGDQSNGSIHIVMWGMPKIHDSPGRLPSIKPGRELLEGWVFRVPSWVRRMIFPSETESCYTSSSSAPWWIKRAPRAGLLPSPMSGG